MKLISTLLTSLLQHDQKRPNSNYSADRYQKFVSDLDLRKTDFLPRVHDLHDYLNQTSSSDGLLNDRQGSASVIQWLSNGLMFESGADHRRILVGHDYADENTIINQLRTIKQQFNVTCVVINSKADWYNSHTLDENTTLVLVMSNQTFIAIQRQLENYTDSYLVV